MKKKILILLIAFIIMPFKVYASGGFSVSPTTVTLNPGKTKKITIKSNNSVGKLNISSSNSSIASVSKSTIFIKTPGSSDTFTITAKSVGTTTISVVATSSFATMDEEILTGVTKKVTVKVVKKTTESSNTSTNKTTSSTNNKLKTISVVGYNLEKVNNNSYKLSVGNNVTNVTVNATAEDKKATVTGTGSHELKIGQNTIEIVITSESGKKNKINIIVTRKDGYYLEDLSELLNNSNITDINIKIKTNDKLTKEQLEQIKKSGKTIKFNYYDENNILKYSWIIDGSKISNYNELYFDILNNSDNSKKISQITNYASLIYLNFKYEGSLPENTRIKYFVGDLYNDNDSMYLYYYNKTKNIIERVQSNLVVSGGYVEFNLEHCSEYFLSMSDININSSKSFNWFIIISIVEFIILVFALLYYFLVIKKRKYKVNNDDIINNMGTII